MKQPKLSVVIASCVGKPFINRCLASLEVQCLQADVKCIVVNRASRDVAHMIEQEFPWVVLVQRPPDESVPDLRRAGINIAQTEYVAIIEEHCIASDNWIETMLDCIKEPVAAIGGVVEHANYSRTMDWAVYFTEYNSYMPPVARSETTDVCAANCVYRRDLLARYLPQAGSGYWEAGLNHTLLSQGERFLNEPRLVVHHTGPFGLCYYLRQRFLFSRAFAGVRREHASTLFRLVYLCAAPLLVPLLWARTSSRILLKGKHIGKFIRVTPYMVPITITYVFGEWVGLLAGSGNSLSKIE